MSALLFAAGVLTGAIVAAVLVYMAISYAVRLAIGRGLNL